MLTILLIRTGATEYECQGRVQGTLDIPLSEDGRQQIKQVASELGDVLIDALYAGPCRATQQSAEMLAGQLKLKSKAVENLRNVDLGLWQGMLIDEVKVKQPKVYRQWQEHPETVCPPEGETLTVVRERLQLALAKLTKKHKSGTIAMVVPEPASSILKNLLRADPLGNLWQVEDDRQPAWEAIELSAPVASH